MKQKVTGCIREKKGRLYAVLYWYEVIAGKKTRKSQWIPTGLEVRGNKRKAKGMLPPLILEKERSLNYGKANYNDDMYFSVYMKEWLEEKKVDKVRPIRQNTYEGYARLINRYINPYFDKLCMKLTDLKRKDLDAFYTYLLTIDLSANTIHKVNVVIHQAMAAAVDKELLTINPAIEIKSIPKIEKYRADYYNKSEIDNLLEAFKGDPMEAVVKLTVFYGFRRSEVLGLRWSAINFEEDIIEVNHTAIRLNADIVYEDKCKNLSSMRMLPLSADMKEYLISLKRKQDDFKALFGDTYHDNEYICKWEDGRLFDPSYISHHFSLMLQKTGLRHIRFHELRHSTASYLVALGFSLKDVQEWLGHSTITITADTYSHVDLSSKRKIADRLDTNFGAAM